MIDHVSSHHKLSIQHHLAGLLNLSPTDDDDYISEILQQLLSIESPDDVAEYLSNFIVDEGSGDLDSFVKELARFKSGDHLDSSHSVQVKNESSNRLDLKELPKPAATASSSSRILDEGAARREEIRLRELEAREKQRDEQERARLKRSKDGQERKRSHEKSRQSQQNVSKWEKKSPGIDTSSARAGRNANALQHPAVAKRSTVKNADKESSLKSSSSTSLSIAAPSKPLMGTPKKVCGCFGNKHPPLTNCLHCGRISCELEGYDYCPFCKHLITQFIPSNKHDSALAHKERLLEYDRTSASRTHVHDDQEDYFVTQTSMWSSVSEQEEASALEEERRRKLHGRQKQVLDVMF